MRATSVIRFLPPKHVSTESVITNDVAAPVPSFLAVIVYCVAGDSACDVPEILPVCGSRSRPVGSAGDTVKS